MKTLATCLLSIFLLVRASPCQFTCYGDDGFFDPTACCIPVTNTNLPPFPAFTVPSDGACFLDCSIDALYPVTVNLGAPIQILDDVYAIPITLGGTVTTAFTYLIAKYARTWVEADPTGVGSNQIWRFLVNTDLIYVSTGPSPCPVPPCGAVGFPVHMVGSVDYARNCIVSTDWHVAINLTHFCGDLAHGPFSAYPTNTFNHPDRLYSIVGPAPFDFAATQPTPTGNVLGEDTRSVLASLSPLVWDVFNEVPVLGGQLTFRQPDCPCASFASANPRWEQLDLSFFYGCATGLGGNFTNLAWPGTIPSGLYAFPLGTYQAPPGTYPQNRAVAVYVGVAAATDTCANNIPIHLVHGVSTYGSVPGFSFHMNTPGIVYQNFIDFENMLRPVVNQLIIGYGGFFLSTMNWSLNVF